MVKLPKSPAIMASVTSTLFLSSTPDELCHRLKILLQKKHAGNISHLINEENFAIFDKLIEYKCMSKKQHEQHLIKCNLLQEKV